MYLIRKLLSSGRNTSPRNISVDQNKYDPMTPKTPISPDQKPSSSRPNPGIQPSKKYSFIGDDFHSVDQVTEALRDAGLETSNLIVGIDFTKSNEWTGKHSFSGRSLHTISSNSLNPYEQAIQIVGKTLHTFDDDNLIPCFGFGDVNTYDQYVFSFYADERPCDGFEGVLSRYKEITPHVKPAGPTSFAPVIKVAMNIVEQSGGRYHVLLIIADGQVTRSIDTALGNLSSQEQATIDAIVEASQYALSIVLVGVGDGPWDTMKQFDDNIPRRAFDNFQFVNFTSIMSKNLPQAQKEAAFALAALMEIPTQYKATLELGILNRTQGKIISGLVKSPPPGVLQLDFNNTRASGAPGANTGEISDIQSCPICLTRRKDMAFGCGHQTCRECSTHIDICPICRQRITTKLRLYG